MVTRGTLASRPGHPFDAVRLTPGRHPSGRPPVDQTRSCAFVGHQLPCRRQKARLLPAPSWCLMRRKSDKLLVLHITLIDCPENRASRGVEHFDSNAFAETQERRLRAALIE